MNQREVPLVFWSCLVLEVAVACGKSELAPRRAGDPHAGQSGRAGLSGSGGQADTGGASTGGSVGGGPSGGTGDAPGGGLGGSSGGTLPTGGAGNAGQPGGAGPVAGSAGLQTGGAAAGGDAGEDAGGEGPGGEGGRGDVPGFDDLIVRSSLMDEFEGKTVHASLRRLLPRSAVVVNGAFEIRWEQAFDRMRFGYILLLFVDLDGDGACTQGSDPAWARHIYSNSPETGPVVAEFDPDAQGGGFPPIVTCADLESL
jgi:hypothetical protein